METGKPQSVSALLYGGSVAVPTERKMDARAPLTAVYIQALPALPPPQQLFQQAPFPVTPPPREPATTLRLAMPPLYTKDTLPFLAVHITGGPQPLRQELSLATAVPLVPLAPVASPRPKSAGKHVCPHCGRDCMKPSVLEKHLRCHTGERPYPCATCRVSFKTQSNLYKHKRTQAHARLSVESSEHSAKSGSMGSQESLCGSSVCSSSLDSQVEEESGSLEEEEEEVGLFPLTKYSCTARLTEKVHCGEKPGTDPEQGPTGVPVQGKIDLSSVTQKTEPVQSPGLAKEEVKGKEGETKKLQGVTPNRHLPLQRQEATLSFKEWEGSASRGKPQSHKSTDSGFSESTDHNMDALPECITEHHERSPVAGLSQNEPDPRDSVPLREQRSLEEHISKLISENSVVVEDKHLEHMRPRKTVLSKQGSIDLPMPYMYKDSFHFDMRNNPTPVAGLHGNRRPMLQSSLPQPPRSASMEQAPLTRSSSLPYSVALLTPEQSKQNFSHPRDYVNLIHRGSSGPVNPTAFSGKSVDQQAPAHRPLVRQAAVDCNHATEGLFSANSSAERPPINSDLSCDGGGGSDICVEPSDRKRPRKKAQKFTYNKWYAYKGGTFKKLYNTTKGGDSVMSAAKEPPPSGTEHSRVQSAKSLPGSHNDGTTTANSTTGGVEPPSPVSGMELNPKSRHVHQACSSPRPPLLSHVSHVSMYVSSNRSPENYSTDIIGRPAERPASKEKHSIAPAHRARIPSDRKKQRTNDSTIVNPSRTEAGRNTPNEQSSSATDVFPTQNTNVSQVSLRLDQRVDQHGGGLLPQCISASNEQTSVKPPASVSLLSSTTTSFLPKYQLKLPSTTETKSTPSLHTLKMSKRNDSHSFTTSVSSSSDNQHFLPSIGKSSGNECTLQPHMLSGNPQSTNEETNSTQTVNKCESLVTGLNHGATLALAVSQRHCTTITTATATMRSHHKELCSQTVIRTSPFKPLMAPHAEHLTRPVLQNQSIMTFTTGRWSSQSPSLSSSTTTFTTFSQGHRPNLSHVRPLRTLPSLSQLNPANAVSSVHLVPSLPFQMLPFDPGQLDPIQKVFHVQTADLQICLQIISDEQLALIEPRMEKQAATSESRNTPQTRALNSTVPVAGACRENAAQQLTCGQREVDNMELPPSPDPRYTKLNSMGLADVSQVQVSGNTNVSGSLQPLIHPHSDANHNTAADSRCCTGGAVPPESLPKAVKPEARKTQGESDLSFSAGLAAKELGEVTPLFPGELLQEGSQYTPLSKWAITYTVKEVTAKPNDRVCAPTTSQGREARPRPQRGRARACTHAETDHIVHHPGEGSSLFPENKNQLCSASGEVNADPPVYGGGGGGGGGGDDLVDPGPGHSDTRLQPLSHSLAVPLIQSSSSYHTALCDSTDTPASLAQPQTSGHGSSLLVGGLASQRTPESQGCRSSPGQPDSVGPGPAQKSQESWDNRQCVEEAEENAQVDAWTAPGFLALPRSQTQRGMSAGLAATLSHLAPAGGDIIPPRPAASTIDTAHRSGVGQPSPAETNPLCVQADPPHQNPTKTQDVTLKPTGVPPASTWDTVSAVIHTAVTYSSDTLACCSPQSSPTTQSLLPQSALPAHAPNNSSTSSAWTEEEEEVHLSESCALTCAEHGSTVEVEGGEATQEHTVYCEDPLGGEGEGFPSSGYHHHHHRQEEEVVLSEAQLGGHQFTEGSSTTNMWPLLPNCQGQQDSSSDDDDDEGKLIIEL